METPATGPVWLDKRQGYGSYNEEFENLVQGFQLSEQEWKEPDIILKYVNEHFMANEGVLTEREKFA